MSKDENMAAGEKMEQKDRGKKVFWIGLIVIAVVAVLAVAYHVLTNVNRTAKQAAEAAFEAIYGCDYEKFVEASIYNSDCQASLNMELDSDLALIEDSFDEMKDWMEETGETYKVTSAEAKEYDAEDEAYQTGIDLFTSAYDGVATNQIVKVATVEITFRAKYKDEHGEWQDEELEDTYWCYEVDGKWYCYPMLDTEY